MKSSSDWYVAEGMASSRIQSNHEQATFSPLLIDLVLRQILFCLPVESLMNCRLVNRSWNDAALHCLRQKRSKWIDISPRAFPRFCSDFEKCAVLPFTRFYLRPLTEVDVKCCVKFFTQHGPDIHDLDITVLGIVHSQSHSHLQSKAKMNSRKIQHMLGQTPNLKRLSLHLGTNSQFLLSVIADTKEGLPFRFPQMEMLTIDSIWPSAWIQKFLDGVFAMAPNLRVLVIWDALVGQGNAVMEAMQKLQLRAVLFGYETWLQVSTCRAVGDTQKLKSLGISLRSRFNQTSAVVEAQEYLLESQADYLETLFLLNGEDDPTDKNENVPKLRLPVLKKLTSLSLSFYQLFDTNMDPKKVPFNIHPLTPEQVPSLRRLSLYTLYLGLEVIADSPFRAVTQLILQNQENEYYPGVLLQVASRFPKLKKLHNLCILNLSSSDVALMVSSWPDMEDLFLTLWSDKPQTDFNSVLSGVVAEGDWRCRGPSLCHFKSLKKCVLNFTASTSDNWFHLDECVVYLTFLRLPSQLLLHLRGDFSISDDLRTVLRGHYQVRIYFTEQRAQFPFLNWFVLLDDFMKSSKQ